MATRAIPVALAMSALWLSGCGTAYNLCGHGGRFGDGDKKVYGGVIKSFNEAKYSVSGNPFHYLHGVSLAVFVPHAQSLFVDLPLSAIGDTLTLPWTISASLNPSRPSEHHSAPDVKTSATPNPETATIHEPVPGKTSLIYDARLKD
jgi:uncharacterized protein YceK